MRQDTLVFARADRAQSRRPRYVIRIGFPTASIHFASHDDITGIPGVVVENVVKHPSAISQRLAPDEGRSEIGSFSFTLVDVESAVTDAIRAHYFDDEGLRGREVKFYVGYEGFGFSDFVLFTTQIVVSDEVDKGIYSIQCRDITRETNKEIFKPVATTLRLSVTASDTTIPVGDTSDFELIAHGSSYTDAPNQTVGYFRLEDEVIRYTGKTANSFTGCTRGILNTVAKPHAISDTASQDRQPKVEEYIYLEMPGPKLAYAILTGSIYGTANTLPDHWHLGVDSVYVRVNDFLNIGIDLWDTSNDSNSLVLRFEGLKAQDGKRFVDREIYLLLGCFSPVYANGALGLRRMSPLISGASPAITLTESQILEISGLEHDGESMHNQFRINWAWDTLADDYIRESRYVDAASIEVHQKSSLLTYEFRGLHGERHTDITIAQRLASIRDRYSTPPERMSVTLFGSFNRIEVGDVVRIKLTEETLRDYALDTADFNRSFEVHQQTYDAAEGRVSLELFGSTYRIQAEPPVISDFHALPDTWYTSEGTALSTVLTIVGNVVQAGSYTINGATTATASGAIFYHNADLTIADGANITITGNVQLRIKGFLQINGDVNGSGGGLAGVSDGGGAISSPISGTSGFVGNSRGWDGLHVLNIARGLLGRTQTVSPALTRGRVDAVPVFELSASGGVLSGLPTDLRGTGGGPGGRFIPVSGGQTAGGAGAAGGAGLIVVCRGIAFGASGSIVLDGANSVAPSTVSYFTDTVRPGAGGGGGPGALLILLDGSSISFPLISGKFYARGGTVPVGGTPLPARELYVFDDITLAEAAVIVGFADPDAITLSGFDYSTVAYGIQYIAEPLNPESDSHPHPPPPTGLSASSTAGGNLLVWTSPGADLYNVIEIYASADNNRSNAIFVGEVKGTSFIHSLPLGSLYYYWIRSARTWADGRVPSRSTWEPVSEVGGIVSNAETPGETPDRPSDLFATGMTNGIRFTWAVPAVGRLLGRVRLFEGAVGSLFEDASLFWDGYAFTYFLQKTNTTPRDYWIQLYRGGQFSSPEPQGNGVTAAASAIVAALTASVSPDKHSVRSTSPIGLPTTLTTPSSTVTATGGVPGYSYFWSLISGNSDIVINSPTAATTTFSSTGQTGTAKKGVARCTVTDTLGLTASGDVGLTFIFASPIF